jgi:hypothetical protein
MTNVSRLGVLYHQCQTYFRRSWAKAFVSTKREDVDSQGQIWDKSLGIGLGANSRRISEPR